MIILETHRHRIVTNLSIKTKLILILDFAFNAGKRHQRKPLINQLLLRNNIIIKSELKGKQEKQVKLLPNSIE